MEVISSQKRAVRQIISISSKKKAVQQIISTHSPDRDNFDVDKTTLLSMAQEILCSEIPTLTCDLVTDSMDLVSQQGISEKLAFTIHKIGCQLSCNCSGGGGMKSVTLAVFEALVKYSWEDKLVLALSAFAVSYGKYSLLSKPPDTNPLAKYVAQLKPLPEISDLKNNIIGLLNVVVCVTKTVIELNDLLSQYNSRDKAPSSDDEISIGVYWAVRGIIACCSQSIGLINQQNMVSIIETRERLIELTETLNIIHGGLATLLEENKIEVGYYRIQCLIRSIHADNMEILSELIQTKDGKALFNGATDAEASLDVLKSRTVIFFISSLDITVEEVQEIEQQVWKPQRQYEVVWLPICNTDTTVETDEIEEQIRSKAIRMKCHSLHYWTLQSYVIQYIKKEWLFQKKKEMVVFDAYGKVVNSSAYTMFMIWGSAAYPFHAQTEEALWRKWSIERLLIEGVVSEKLEWVEEKRAIYLYGGDDLEWIRTFTSKTKEVVKSQDINIELIYVGKKHTETIKKENLSEVWEGQKLTRFQTRLNRIYQLRIQLGKSITEDKTLKQFKMLLDAGGDGQGWTIIGQGSNDMAIILDEKLAIESHIHLENKVEITKESFISTLYGAIKTAKRRLKSQEMDSVHKHCDHIFVPTGHMVCVDCQRPLEKESMHHIQVMHQKIISSSHSESVAVGMSSPSPPVSK